VKLQLFLLTVAALALPAALWVAWPYLPAYGEPVKLLPSRGTSYPRSQLPLKYENLDGGQTVPALIANVHIASLDGGPPDILACDNRLGRVVRCRRASDGSWQEEVLGDEDLLSPCGSTIADLDADGDSDILVPVLGSLAPTPESLGRVVLLVNDGEQKFTNRVLFENVGRVSDVQAGDLDGDGDLDLVVAEFGFDHGGIWWLENVGALVFREHLLLGIPGCIHVPLADLDGDGDLDLIALVSQDEEEVLAFENQDGKLTLRKEPLFQSANFDLGTSGLTPTDLDQDGKLDFLLSAGDNLEISYPAPQSWHGCFWLRGLGDWKFESRRISDLAGTYAAAAGDIDGDGDLDVALAGMFNDWRAEGMASCVWLENDGSQSFKTWQIADRPTHLATIACGDLDADGRADIVAGPLHFAEPTDRLGRIAIWTSSNSQESP
jgi:hypothetical protein